MSDPLDIGQWAKHWESMARQAQATFAGRDGTGSDPSSAWAEALRGSPFASGGKQSEALEHLLAGAQGYLAMLQSLANGGAGAGADADSFNRAFFGAAPPFAHMNQPLLAAMRGFGRQGAQGFEQWMEQFSAAAKPVLDQAHAAFALPAFGHLREKQVEAQQMADALLTFREQSARYDRLMLKIGEQAFARFQLKLAEREEPGRQIDSVRALYDLWIDAAEEAHAEAALSEEFREVYAAVVDAQMQVRKRVQAQIEKACNELGMPTRSEVNSIGERLQALRREVRAARESTGTDAMREEIESLRRELAALKRQAPANPPTAKPDAVEKPVKARPAKAAAKVKAPKPSAVKSGKQAAAVASAAKPASAASARRPRSAGKGGSFAASLARFANTTRTGKARPTSKTTSARRRGGKQ